MIAWLRNLWRRMAPKTVSRETIEPRGPIYWQAANRRQLFRGNGG